jgi:hypothetical protein
MLKKIIAATAAAAFLCAGSLATTTTTASATSYSRGHINGNGWFFSWGHWPQYQPYHPPTWNHPPPRRQVCTPLYKTVRYWKPYRGWVSYRVYAGRVCRWQPIYQRW